VAFSPDSRLLGHPAASTTPSFLDVCHRRDALLFPGKIVAIVSVKWPSFPNGGRDLACGGENDTVKLWDVETGQDVAELVGHKGPVFTACLQPRRKHLASVWLDFVVNLVRGDGQELLKIRRVARHRHLESWRSARTAAPGAGQGPGTGP